CAGRSFRKTGSVVSCRDAVAADGNRHWSSVSQFSDRFRQKLGSKPGNLSLPGFLRVLVGHFDLQVMKSMLVIEQQELLWIAGAMRNAVWFLAGAKKSLQIFEPRNPRLRREHQTFSIGGQPIVATLFEL